MELSDIYSNQVKPSVINTFSYGKDAPIITRDPNVRALEQSVFAQLRSVIPVEPEQNLDIPKAPTIKHVSFEDALKELISL